MESTEQQFEKLELITSGSLVAGIIADCNHNARQQQVNVGSITWAEPTKTICGLKMIPFTDLGLKRINASSITPTAYDQTLKAEKKRRAICAALMKSSTQLTYLGHRILAYKLGVSFFKDHRRRKVSPVLVDGLRIIAQLFEVDSRLNYKCFANLFDAYGWRRTSVDELRQLGRELKHGSPPFNKREVHIILRDLQFTGYLEQKKVTNPVKRWKQLFIRFRPDRVQQAIKAVTFLSEAETKCANAAATHVEAVDNGYLGENINNNSNTIKV